MSKIKTSEILQVNKLEAHIKSLEKFPEQAERGIAMMREYETGCILFLGINPSFLNDKNGNRPPIPGEPEYEPFYDPIEVKEKNEMDKKYKEDNRHFMRAIEISHDLGYKYVYHLDLLSVRETEETEVRKIISLYPSYLDEQISNATAMISSIHPSVIIVENGFIRNLFFDKHIFGFYPATKEDQQGWNEELGVDFVRIGESYVPILFSGMLASLNSGSYYSLKWHIRHILKNIDKWPKIEE